MRKVSFTDLNERIDARKSEVEQKIIGDRNEGRLIRTRERDKDEQKIIDKLCVKRWKIAEQEGKIRYLSKRKWFYDFD